MRSTPEDRSGAVDVQAEKARRLSADALMRTLPDLIARFDPDLHLLDANPAYARAMALDEAEMGRTAQPGAAGGPAAPEDWAATLKRVFETGETLQASLAYGPDTGERRHLEALLLPEFDASGACTAVFLSGRDITHHVRAQQRVVASERRYRALVETAASVVWRRSADGQSTLELHPGERMDPDLRSLSTDSWPEALHPDDLARTEAAWAEALRARAPFEVEHRSRMPDGEYRWFHARAVPLLDADGNPVEWVGASTDVTEQKAAEERLAASQGRFESLVHQSMEAITLLAPDGTVVYQTPSIRRLLGHEPEALIGRNLFEFLHPEDAPSLAKVLAAFVSGSPEQRARFRLRSGAREWRWFEAVGTNLLHDPNVRAVVINSRDVTDQIEAQHRLEESEGKYRALVEQSGQLVYDYEIEGGAIGWSGNILGITGHTPADFAAMGIDAWSERLHPDDREGTLDLLERALRDGAPFDAAYRFRHADGTYRHIEDKGMILPPEASKKLRMAGMMADVTDRVVSAEALRNSESRYRSLSKLISAYAFAYRVDDGGELHPEWFTETVADVLGLTTDEILRTPTGMLTHPDDVHIWKARNETVVAGKDCVLEFRMRHRNGTYRWVRSYSFPAADASGRVVRIYGAAQDVTAQKEAEAHLMEAKERAEEMSRLKDAFLANMSHEIRTPLASILGFSELLRDIVDEEGQEFVNMISLGGRRLKDTLTSVLELSQLQAGRIDLHPVPLDVAALVDETTALLQAQANEGRVLLRATCTPSPLRAHIDRAAVARILINLAGNAIKFTGPGGAVSLSTCVEGDMLRLTVADNGIGIGEEFLPHLFDEFRQESTGHSRSHEGSGLGLAIAKRLVDLMGGTISAESVKGTGTTFTVRLPYHPVTESRAEAATDTSAAGGPRRRLLLVEDDESTRRFVALALRGFGVVDVGSSAEALAAVSEGSERFDLVLLDINLGEALSGEDLLPRLREAAACRQARFIATTAFALPGDEERFLGAGFDGYLAKPFLRTDLLCACREQLSC